MNTLEKTYYKNGQFHEDVIGGYGPDGCDEMVITQTGARELTITWTKSESAKKSNTEKIPCDKAMLVRKIGKPSETFMDGTIMVVSPLTEGMDSVFIDTNVEPGVSYFYTVYTLSDEGYPTAYPYTLLGKVSEIRQVGMSYYINEPDTSKAFRWNDVSAIKNPDDTNEWLDFFGIYPALMFATDGEPEVKRLSYADHSKYADGTPCTESELAEGNLVLVCNPINIETLHITDTSGIHVTYIASQDTYNKCVWEAFVKPDSEDRFDGNAFVLPLRQPLIQDGVLISGTYTATCTIAQTYNEMTAAMEHSVFQGIATHAQWAYLLLVSTFITRSVENKMWEVFGFDKGLLEHRFYVDGVEGKYDELNHCYWAHTSYSPQYPIAGPVGFVNQILTVPDMFGLPVVAAGSSTTYLRALGGVSVGTTTKDGIIVLDGDPSKPVYPYVYLTEGSIFGLIFEETTPEDQYVIPMTYL